jgi:hypothetical protein
MIDGVARTRWKRKQGGHRARVRSAWRWRGQGAPFVIFGLLLAVGAAFSGTGAQAQASSQTPALIVPATFTLPPGGAVPLSIKLTPAPMPPRSIILIRGLPATIALSEGRRFDSGVWAIAAAHVGPLRITSSTGAAGRSDLAISLMAIDGTLLAEAQSAVVIAEAAQVTAAVPANTLLTGTAPLKMSGKPYDIPLPASKRPTASQTEQLLAVVKKGDELLAGGNVAAARLLYGHAADGGLAAAALAMATTFDERELTRYRLVGGVQSDRKQAQFWYEKAREMGSSEAQQRLARLGSR